MVPSFPEGEHAALHPLREGHFWFTHRRECIVERAGRLLAGRDRPRILEMGCGDGDVLEALAARFTSVGLERRVEDLRLARSRGGVAVVAAEGSAPPFRPGFDLVGLFDVIEHVADAAELLRVAASLAVPGGWVLVTVPADPKLWTNLDVYTGHYRRYTKEALIEIFRSAGLDDPVVQPLFRFLWPIGRVIAAAGGRRIPNAPHRTYRKPGLLNAVLLAVLRVERRFAPKLGSGRGTSWIAAARTPAGREAAV